MIGAPGADANGQDSGAAYVFFGAADFAVAEGLSGMFFDTDPVSSIAEAEAAIANSMPAATYLAYQIDYPNSDDDDTVDASTRLSDFFGLNVEKLSGGENSDIDGSVFTFEGYLHVSQPGTYSFEVGSQEGFSLTIDGTVVADFDGQRTFDQTSGTHTFTARGFYPISLLYYTDSDPAGIELKSDLSGTLDFITREQLFSAPPTSTFELGDLTGLQSGFVLQGEAAGDALGAAVGGGGDLNADGSSDVVVGAPGADANGTDSGQAYLLFGEAVTTTEQGFANVYQTSDLDGTSGLVINGAAAGARAGAAVELVGDLNADGNDDLAIGATAASGGLDATAHVVFGDAPIATSGPIELSSLDGIAGFSLTTATSNDLLGTSLGGQLESQRGWDRGPVARSTPRRRRRLHTLRT